MRLYRLTPRTPTYSIDKPTLTGFKKLLKERRTRHDYLNPSDLIKSVKSQSMICDQKYTGVTYVGGEIIIINGKRKICRLNDKYRSNKKPQFNYILITLRIIETVTKAFITNCYAT